MQRGLTVPSSDKKEDRLQREKPSVLDEHERAAERSTDFSPSPVVRALYRIRYKPWLHTTSQVDFDVTYPSG